MILKASAEGLLIPKDYLSGAEEFDIVREDGRIVVVPLPERDAEEGRAALPVSLGVKAKRPSIFDPIHVIGANPVRIGVSDGSVNHDDYIYGDPHGDRS